ncbi:hypothetical protein V6N13_145956 [Hibiscus sabdariffa]|uniref:Glutaredoxin domain-containing protein n=1 Tax=Hibiscus sabdariffa TaxID=183260 RepID=A0ABR2TR75_9ROSI
MGCSTSKSSTATVDYYRPLPSSFAVFDINAIDEPWVKAEQGQQENREKPTHVPAVLLEKLNALEAAPHSWDEVSKALEDLKPAINDNKKPPAPAPAPAPAPKPAKQENKNQSRKSLTFHTLEELDAKLSSKESKPPANELRETESMGKETKTTPRVSAQPVASKLKDNIFILKDREEREKEGRMANYDKIMTKRDPLSEFPEICPPGGNDTVVIYTTSLRGVRRTFEDCNKVRGILEVQRVVFDERDVSLHGEFLNELRELLGDEATVPSVFVKGRYLGGAEEVSELNETGKFGKILSMGRVERGVGRLACGGCGGARFVPCVECGGSCKVAANGADKWERCGKCNENGLIQCPTCL